VLFMVVERFSAGAAAEIYRRVREGGRALPAGLAQWGDLAEFEIVPVTSSRATQELMTRLDA
jgi:hypothetical protein